MCANSPPITRGLAAAAMLLLLLLLLQRAASTSVRAGTTAEAEEAPAFRLPETVLPSHYDLYIETFLGDDGDDFKFQGHVVITLAASEPVQEIRLHAKDLEVDEKAVQLTSEDDTVPAVSWVQPEPENEFIVVGLDGPLPTNTNCSLRLDFSAPLGEGLAGYYRSSYVHRASGETRWLSVTQFEATDARRAFPCFDEPAFKATFSISLGYRNKYSAISNMPELRSEPMKERPGWSVAHFQRSLRMSTYLVAFVVSDLDHSASTTADNKTEFRVWARPEALKQTRYATEVGPQVLSFYETFFQVPYPLPKQDMIAIPDFNSGAMENWGLITYRERLLLLDDNVSSVLAKRDVAGVIAHELAHQWFGNLVTMRWWNDLWLNEGFATYVATLGTHSVHPNWNTLDIDALTNMLTVLRFDALETSHPLSVPLNHPSEIPQIFDAISYKKGSFLIRMMSHFLGESAFRAGVTSYLRQHRLGNAEQDDLWAALTAEAHRDSVMPLEVSVKAVMDTWTLQTGYPLLTVSRDYARRTVSIQQAKYLSYQSDDPRRTADTSCWVVPLTLATARAPHQVRKAWFHCEKGQPVALELTLEAGEDDWLLLNINATGLFRVLYDEQGWELLTAALRRADPTRWPLAALDRAHLVDDALALAWSGDLPYRLPLALLTYLRREVSYLPWKAAFYGLMPVYRLVRRTAGYGLYRDFVVGLMEEALKQWGDLRRPPPADDLEGFRQRSAVVAWACRLGEPSCVRQARELYAEWMRQPDPDSESPVPHGLEYEVVCTAVRHGGEAQWRFGWQRYLKSNVPSVRLDLLQAVACTREPWLLQRMLEWSVQEGQGIRRQDSASVFSSVANNVYGFHIAKDFLFRNIDQLLQFYGPRASRISRYIKAIAEDMYTEQDAQQFDEFVEQNKEQLSAATMAVKQAREKIAINMGWMRAHYTEVMEQLQQMASAKKRGSGGRSSGGRGSGSGGRGAARQ